MVFAIKNILVNWFYYKDVFTIDFYNGNILEIIFLIKIHWKSFIIKKEKKTELNARELSTIDNIKRGEKATFLRK